MPPPTLFTVGYEFATLPSVIEALRARGVKTLIDVRELPLSRRAGFSKRPLNAELSDAGIGYVHLRALGTPKEGRVANKQGKMAQFWRIVDGRLATPEAERELAAAADLARRGPACLLCFEADPETCHRLRVGALLAERYGFEVEHLRSSFEPAPAARPARAKGAAGAGARAKGAAGAGARAKGAAGAGARAKGVAGAGVPAPRGADSAHGARRGR
ncbi:MAG TPA: DUF488 domain-containing protein [Polyangiaceae bacterium]|nr:DUF488 domain-containing protein [Polyangiaceae bacterium]